MNQATKGSLKIVKTSSDGRKEGFAFRVKGVNEYDMSFTTDANGEILVENLRVGEYVITELKNSVSEEYSIADPVTVMLVANETLTVKIHNSKVTLDVPKTGDETKLALWIALVGIGITGLSVTAFLFWKRRKSRESIQRQ